MKNITTPIFYFIILLSFSINLLAETIYIKIPTVISPPKVNVTILSPAKINKQTQEVESSTHTKQKSVNKSIGFSKRVPPNYHNINEELVTLAVNDANNSNVSAFLTLENISIEKIRENLKKNNFTILAEHTIDKKGLITSIVFTNNELTKIASKNQRGFVSTLRILINKQSNITSITNPIYTMKAFLQEDYNQKLAQKIFNTLHKAFNNLQESPDTVKFTKLSQYRYMDNMPYYKDMEVVASGSNKKLLQYARKSKKIVYEHPLKNGSVIIGVKLSKRTRKFVKKIGYQNAGLLPYPVLIENNKAQILSPQYYIALMYPKLNMTEFMSIASIPGAIVKDCGKVFRNR